MAWGHESEPLSDATAEEVAALRKRVEELSRERDVIGDACRAECSAWRKRVEELEGQLGQCAKDWGEARDLGQQHLDRAEKAERERDSYRRDFDGAAHACDKLQADLDKMKWERDEAMASLDAELERRMYEPVCGCMVDHPGDVCGVHSPALAKLQADLDAALDVARGVSTELKLLALGHPFRKETAENWAKNLDALLEKRRQRG